MENKQNACFGDKERTKDLLNSENHLTGIYNAFLIESATPEVTQCLSDLLMDTHRAQQQVFAEMNSRGWYPVSKAEESKVTQVKDQYAASVCPSK